MHHEGPEDVSHPHLRRWPALAASVFAPARPLQKPFHSNPRKRTLLYVLSQKVIVERLAAVFACLHHIEERWLS